MVALTFDDATTLATTVLVSIGTPGDIAEEIAGHLVEADRVGHSSHGITQLPTYIDYVDHGVVVPGARPETHAGSPCPVVNANRGFSHTAARMTTDLACDRAASDRIGMAGLIRGTHLGRLGAYMEHAARRECISLAFVGGMGGHRLVAPFGGRTGLLSSNPIAAGFPARSGEPFVVDFSTASAPIGKITAAAVAGERMPEQSLVDRDGRPTDDPHALENGGAIRTFGDHKGFGLAVLIELLGRVLLGSSTREDGGGDSFRNQGLLVIAIAADTFRPLGEVLDDAEGLRDSIHAVTPAAGVDRVLAPGDPEQAQRRRPGNTLSISAGAWSKIRESALRAGLTEGDLPRTSTA